MFREEFTLSIYMFNMSIVYLVQNPSSPSIITNVSLGIFLN